MIDLPIANDSVTNKHAQKESIYHTCRSVLNGLSFVEGFNVYMDQIEIEGTDPLTKLGHICRQGSSLCHLYNTLKPDAPIMINKSSSAANKSKAYAYHFIVACRDQLHFPEDTLFTVTELFQNDTNKLVKVVNTVKRILDLLEEEGIITVKSLSDESNIDSPPKDMRDNVVYEFISTERKYVQDLESLQDYMKEVSDQEILSQDTMHYLFGNLNALLDFQRRFLIHMEEQVAHPSKEQRFGSLFIQFEEAFSVYEPFCANFQIAQDLVAQEAPKLQKLGHIMSPVYELPAMLIKPIQRVCKYPLLVQQLIKSTPDDWPFAEENKQGYEAIQRVTKKVNETKRVQENLLVVQDLRKRIADDHSVNPYVIVDSAGQLLLHDKFHFQKHETDHVREVTVFLFQKMVLVCKEIKDVSKNAILIKKKRKEGSMLVRGKISVSLIEHVKGSSSQNGNYTLHISWIENGMQSILLKCRNDEHLRQWLDVIIEVKKSTIKPDVYSTPQTPKMESTNPLLYFDEDEDAYYSDEEYPVEDEYSPVFMRNRSYSYQHQHYRHPEISSRKASLSNPSSNTRHFIHGIPGITVPPLPRSPTTPSLTSGSASTIHSVDSLYSPSFISSTSSSPTSYPPSPTRLQPSPLTENEIQMSGDLWHRRQTQPYESQTIEEEPDQTKPYYSHVRARSQSSPHLQQLPLPSTPYENQRKSNGYYDITTTSTLDHINVKVHYSGMVYVVVVPSDVEFIELQRRIETKIRSFGQDIEWSSGLKYEDEDGDLITISSSEDVQMGFENRGANNTVDLYITA